MTIRKGAEWGRPVERPDGLRTVGTDAAFVAVVAADPAAPVAVAGGDLFRTLGGRSVSTRSPLQELDVDLLRLQLDGGITAVAAAHAVARRPARRGGWLRGPVLVVMNAQFLRSRDVAPRAHPNDGLADVLLVDDELGPRQRWMAARRARTGAHLPHPGLATRRTADDTWEFDEPMLVFADGVRVGLSRSLAVRVEPDAARLYA